MNILVSAAALRTSGARTIYLQFINHLQTRVDGNHYFIMVDKSMEMPEIEGVEYWIVDVSSKWKRICFDLFGLRSLLKQQEIDVVISLQNIGISALKYFRQIIYYHQSLPFFDYHFDPFRKGDLMMMLYKYLYPYFVRHSIGDKTEMIAQIPSIKEGIMSKYHLHPDKVHVLFPDMERVDIGQVKAYTFSEGDIHFVYPASGISYKRHAFLVSVVEYMYKMDADRTGKVRIHLTLNENVEQSLMSLIEKAGAKVNFVFHGVVPHDQLLSMYKSLNGLLFPSVIETLGLPLIECAHFGKSIIACDLQYAHEVLGGYDGVNFVAPYSAEKWAEVILNTIKVNKEYVPLKQSTDSSWEEFFDIVKNSN